MNPMGEGLHQTRAIKFHKLSSQLLLCLNLLMNNENIK